MRVDRKSKYLIYSFTFIFAVSAYLGYRIFLVERNFVVDSTTVCDPQINRCFVSCDAGKCDTDYYAKITKKAYNIQVCNENTEKCEPLVCSPGEQGCKITYCSESITQDNESCTDTKDFQIDKSAPVASSTKTII